MEDVVIYSDGACTGNPGPGGYAAIVENAEGSVELTGSSPQTTNNRMELLAVIEGLRSLPSATGVRVVTDSQYVVNGITKWIHGWKRKGWKNASGQPVKNRDLWEMLDEVASRHRVRWEWIRGHAGHPMNERADALARAAIGDS
jgi:ribonuclease HI